MTPRLLAVMAVSALLAWGSPSAAKNADDNGPEMITAHHELLWWVGRVRLGGPERLPMAPPLNVPAGSALVLGDDGEAWVLSDEDGLLHIQGPGTWWTAGEGRGQRARVVTHPIAPQPRVRREHVWEALLGQSPWRPDFRGAEAELLRPVNTTVRSLSPSLSWAVPTASGALALTLWRVEPTGAWELLEEWRGVQGPTFRPWTSLAPGEYYIWRVRREDLETGDVVERSARFATLSRPAETALAEAISAMEATTEAPGTREALRAALYATWGLREESVATWRAVAAGHPGRAEVKLAVKQAMGIQVRHPWDSGAAPWPFGMKVKLPDVDPGEAP